MGARASDGGCALPGQHPPSARNRYAARRGVEIVRTYADAGKSGFRLEGRNALKCLIDDVQNGRAEYAIPLSTESRCNPGGAVKRDKWYSLHR